MRTVPRVWRGNQAEFEYRVLTDQLGGIASATRVLIAKWPLCVPFHRGSARPWRHPEHTGAVWRNPVRAGPDPGWAFRALPFALRWRSPQASFSSWPSTNTLRVPCLSVTTQAEILAARSWSV